MGLKDCLTDFGVRVVKDKIHNEIEEKKVRDRLSAFIDSEYAKNFNVTREEEIDAQGLFDYLQDNFSEEVKIRLTETNRKRRGEMYDLIMNKAVDYAKANTKLGEQRAKRIVGNAMDILREYYKKKVNFELKFIVSEAAEEVTNTIKDESAAIQKQIQKSNLFSPVIAANNIREGNLAEAARVLSQSQSVINDAHCLKPYYGFSLYQRNGNSQLISVPLIPEAETKYPPTISIVPSDVVVDNRHVEQIDISVLKYSYNHQLPIKINVQEAVKYLGDIKDPSQYEAEELIGKLIEIKPQAFPPAFPCSLSVNDKVYFDYLLMRTKEILEDGTIILDNREQKNRKFAVEFRMNFKMNSINTNITVLSDENKDNLVYNEFAYNASNGGELLIKALNTDDILAYGHLKNTGDSDKYLNNIDILKKVIVVEDYFGAKISIPDVFPMEDYNDLTWLFELITKGTSKQKWTGYTFTFDLAKLKKETILSTEDNPYVMQFTLPLMVEIFNFKEEIIIKRTINDLRFKDLDKLKKKVEVLDEDDSVKVKIIPNPDREGFNDCIDELIKDVS